MNTFFQMLLTVIATRKDEDLVHKIHYLTVENEILRQKLPARITITQPERNRLMEAARTLGPLLKHVVQIVHPSTMLRWFREDKKGRSRKKPVKRGRRRTAEEIRLLIIKLRKENNWGFDRIWGELPRLGVRSVSKSTIKRILKAAGLTPCPKSRSDRWDKFLKRHVESLWQCDFLIKKVVTCTGLRDGFVLVFLHAKTRRVILSPATLKPDAAWMAKQAETFVETARGQGLRVGYVQHDRDGKFEASFEEALKRKRARGFKNVVAAPMMNARVERFVQSIQSECLDYFVAFGTKHLDHLGKEYLAYYHEDRPHQGLGNKSIQKGPRVPEVDVLRLQDVKCRSRLGGLLNSYYRRAA